jgi:hypothetical protein
MSVPELFHHQHRFIGCLAIRRVPRMRPGDRFGKSTLEAIASDSDCSALSALTDSVLHRLSRGPVAHDILLVTQAFNVGPSDPCPALGSDMRCTIHDDRKPATCAVVPLDALLPDRLQSVVLSERQTESVYLGADCIAQGTRPGFTPLTLGRAVVDEDARGALARRRRDLTDEKRWWGEAVFSMLQKDLFANPPALARIPLGGFLTMAIAPVLMVLATVSPRCRQRCIEYIDAQIDLIQNTLRSAVARKRLADYAGTEQLRAFLRTSSALRTGLEKAPAEAWTHAPHDARNLESWMGLSESPVASSPSDRGDARKTA